MRKLALIKVGVAIISPHQPSNSMYDSMSSSADIYVAEEIELTAEGVHYLLIPDLKIVQRQQIGCWPR